MPKIRVHRDGAGQRAVYAGTMLLMDGLEPETAKSLAAFFRAADRCHGSRPGALPRRSVQSREGSAGASA